MGLDGIGNRNIDNIQNISSFQSAPAGKATAKELPSSQQVGEELKAKGEITPEIKSTVDSLKQALSDGSGRTFSTTGAVESLILTPLTLPGEVASAAKTIAKSLENSDQKPTLGSVASATLGLAFLEKTQKDKGV